MEVRELPVGWATARLEEVTEILDSRRIPLNADERKARIEGKEEDELFPYYGATGQVGWIDDFLFDEQLILLGEDGVPFFDPLRHKAYLASGKFWVNNHAHVLRGIIGLADQRYLTSYFNQLDYSGFVSGSTRLKLTQAAMRGIPVPLAPLNEQRSIAAKLDTTLAAVEACRQRLDGVAAILKRFRQAVLAAATSGELTREWREERGESLEPWKTVKTKEAGKIQLGRQRSPKYHNGPTMRPYLRVQNVFEDRIDLDDVMQMDFSGADLEKYTLHPCDILLNEGQSPQYLGRPAMYRGELPGACFTNSLIRFQAGTSVVPDFALLVFRHCMHSGRYVSEGTITTNIAHLSAGRFGEVEFPLPSHDEQTEIVRRAQQLFTLADQLDARLTAARKIVDRLTPALLAKAFRGELVPQDPSDEPASVLLERVRAVRQADAATGTPSRRGRSKTAANPEKDSPPAAPAPPDLLA
jgi:type I restriction enzyme S subunit